MLKKTLFAAATAGLIATGALATTTGTANAAGGFHYNNNGFHFGHQVRPQRRVCKPVFRRVHWVDRWGNHHWQRVKVGKRCHRAHPRRWHRPNHWGYRGDGFSFRFSW